MHITTNRRSKRLARTGQRCCCTVDESRQTYWRHTKAGIWPEPIDVDGIPHGRLERDRRPDRTARQAAHNLRGRVIANAPGKAKPRRGERRGSEDCDRDS